VKYNPSDHLDREVYCLLGVPVDAIGMPEALSFVEHAVRERKPCFLSTVNLNFLALSRRYPEFHRSLLDSDLCTADGVGVTTLARLNGVSLPERVSGADLLDLFRSRRVLPERRLKLFLFGGQEGVAAIACQKLGEGAGATCAGYRFPGFGDIEDMSDAATIAAINASGADAVIVSLGARKGQAWIMANRHRIEAPVISHLGAAINFLAGTVKRAPRAMQRLGLEWLWRIGAEPYLWKRYAGDAALVARALVATRAERLGRSGHGAGPLEIESAPDSGGTRLRLAGVCDRENVAAARTVFREALSSPGPVRLEFGNAAIDSRFLGLVQMFDRELRSRGRLLTVHAGSSAVESNLRLHGAEYLLSRDNTG
jgi:N-acetylglucosaminyldiphosphoundecaprenol N-acetyl-beta-D-mannosaminyltransferase